MAKKQKKNPILKSFHRLLILLFLIAVTLGILFYVRTYQNGGGIKGALCTLFRQSAEDIENLKPINVLVLGISEDIEKELTDTIILCTYDPHSQTASMLSIPRDTFIGKNKSSAKGSDKINSLYSKGIKKVITAVQDITGTEIDHYVVVKTSSLIKIIDIIGYVEFDVPIDMNYDDPTQDLHINLSKGLQKIDGPKAEQLLRFRHNNDGSSYPAEYGDNDFGRMKTQREFIKETLKQTLTLKNIFKMNKIVNTIFDNIDTDLTKQDIAPYIPSASELDINSIEAYQLPGESEKCNNLWFFIYNKKETQKIVSQIFKK